MSESENMQAERTPVVIAVEDAVLHPEATHIAAATGHPVVDARSAGELARLYSRAHAVFIDSARLSDVEGLAPRSGVFLLAKDTDLDSEGAFLLPAQAADVLKALGRLAAPALPTGGTVLAVTSSAGGAGASTLACAIARVAGGSTLIDAQPYSGGIDLLLGIEGEIGARWGEIALGEGAVDPETLRRALPATDDGTAVLTFSRGGVTDSECDPDRVIDVVESRGVTVVDCPPWAIPSGCGHVAVVVPAEVRAAAAAARIVSECDATATPCSLVVRHRTWSGMSAEDVEKVAKADVIAEVPNIRRIVKATETAGLPARLPRPLLKAAKAVLAEAGAP